MKKRYAVVAGIAIAIPSGSALAANTKDASTPAPASWATLDANDDQVLSREEVAGTPWEDRFERMDANGDGEVTKQEFRAYMQELRGNESQEDSNEP